MVTVHPLQMAKYAKGCKTGVLDQGKMLCKTTSLQSTLK